MAQQDPLEELFAKFLNDKKMTPEEIRQLRTLVQDERNRHRLDQLLAALYEADTQEQSTAESNSKLAFEEVWQKLQVAAPATVHTMRRRSWQKYAAAAAVILACATGSYFILRKPSNKTRIVQQTTPSPKDIPPGGNKAVLTLADGSTITLDDAQNGTLAQQGNTQVVKLADGKLAYDNGSKQSTEISYNMLSTPKGGRYMLILPDGSKVWLNAASSIRYPTVFNAKERKVEITGEAYFEIKKNTAQPFLVALNNMQIEVLGTAFNVNAYENEDAIKTTLIEGSVKVAAIGNRQSAVIKPGEQAVLIADSRLPVDDSRLRIDVAADPSATIAWKDGIIQFGGNDIHTVMRMIARWYDVEVEYRGQLPATHFHGEISSNVPVSEVLHKMELTGEVHFEINDRKIIVTP